jgi:hypothetical protein
VHLLGAFPNPACEQATVRFAVLPRPSDAAPDASSGQRVTLRLYDVLGRQVRTVTTGRAEGRQERRLGVSSRSSGVYVLRLYRYVT